LGAHDKLFGRTIPKDQVGAATSWEFQSLSGAGPRVGGSGNLLTERERRAFERGREEGRREGHVAGVADGRRMQGSRNLQLQGLIEGLRARFAELEADGAARVLDLAVDIARQVLGREVSVARDAVLAPLREALAAIIDQQSQPRVYLHPDDLQLLADDLGTEGLFRHCHFLADASVGRGGCRVETAQSEVDARLATRWRRVLDSLGVCDAPPPEVAFPDTAAAARATDTAAAAAAGAAAAPAAVAAAAADRAVG
jgi:flagellar assembly protein FliH